MNIKILKENKVASENLKTQDVFKFFRPEFPKEGNSGFTLVEALVAISILMIAIASPMALAQKGLSTATLSKDQMIASFLAQDAVEAVKNIRDQIAVSQTTGDWLDGTILDKCICNKINEAFCNFDDPVNLKFCTIDTTRADWKSGFGLAIQIGNVSTAVIRSKYSIDISGTKHFLSYSYDTSSSDASKFSRYINIRKTSDTGDGANEALVNVRVFWNSPQGVQKVDIQDFIYNYSENL